MANEYTYRADHVGTLVLPPSLVEARAKCARGELGADRPREALRRSRMQLREVNWIGGGAIDAALADERREVFVKVRSTRPPQPAWLGGASHALEVELVDGEEGVAPGQACVFYDAPRGQARVLGGGFIKSADSVADAVPPADVRESARANS